MPAYTCYVADVLAITYRSPSGSLTLLLSRRSIYLDTTSGNFERRYLRSHVYANFSRSSSLFFFPVVLVLPSCEVSSRELCGNVLLTPCIHNDDDEDGDEDDEPSS